MAAWIQRSPGGWQCGAAFLKHGILIQYINIPGRPWWRNTIHIDAR